MNPKKELLWGLWVAKITEAEHASCALWILRKEAEDLDGHVEAPYPPV